MTLSTNRIALSQLNDDLGWKQIRYYSTIQTADIDGDGQDEILARWITGLDVYRFENGTLLRHSSIPQLGDNAGFYQPSWYSTIHTAVLDAKLDQADVIARKSDGIHVFRYDAAKHQWREVGANATFRPFADSDQTGTDWTQAKYYQTIQLADITKDGVAELVGRGRNGIQTYSWNGAAECWSPLTGGGRLSDDQGFDQEAYYSSIQLIDLDTDGAAELVARDASGVQTYKWSDAGWTMISGRGPFGDAEGFLAANRYKSVKAAVDAAGRAWLYGVAPGSAGASSGVIQIHQWKDGNWQKVNSIQLPGNSWDSESQFSTLMAADIQGDATPEFLVREPRGLLAFTLDGHSLPMHSESFSDAQGWNLNEHFRTLHPAKARLIEKGSTVSRTLIVGRGANGLEAYKFTGQWTAAADSNFPQYCTNFNTDNSPQCVAYKAISNVAIVGQVDIRSQYTRNDYNQGNWTNIQSSVNVMNNPNGPNSDPNWQTVHGEMVNELGYVATTRGWFDNDAEVLAYGYNSSADLLGEAVSDTEAAGSTSVLAEWSGWPTDIASGIAGFFPEGATIQLFLTVFKDTYDDGLVNHTDLTETVDQIYTDLNDQRNAYTTVNANEQTGYLTDYSKLQQIGRDKETGGFDWSNATLDQVAYAKNGTTIGMIINFYKALVGVKWRVTWCSESDVSTSPPCPPIDTPARYFCQYGNPNGGEDYDAQAYISTGQPPFSPPLNWNLADKLTGTNIAGGNLNAIWYMMMLGADLGWDIPSETGAWNWRLDPDLSF